MPAWLGQCLLTLSLVRSVLVPLQPHQLPLLVVQTGKPV